MGMTLAEKVWADHLVRKGDDGAPDLLYIDLMLMHEVTSPQAFEGLRLAGRTPRHVTPVREAELQAMAALEPDERRAMIAYVDKFMNALERRIGGLEA